MTATLLVGCPDSIWEGVRRLSAPIHCVSILIGSILSQSVTAAPVFFNITGHYYEFITSDATWSEARELASQRTYMGHTGYLATIPTVRENLFLTTTFAESGAVRLAWIGGYEPNDDRAWVWSDGPEAGERFSQSEHPVFPLFFANWGGSEPDSGAANEDFVVINLGSAFAGIGTGEWSAVSAMPSTSNPVRGYLVEYGGVVVVPEPATIALGIFILGFVIGARAFRGD